MNNLNNKFLFFLLFQFVVSNLWSQEIVQLPEVVPPSPNAAALGKYVETPVSSAAGIPNIGIPLYEIKEGDISVPVSLSYHAGGIKVEEIASWVGLGWALNAGGVISRSSRGMADDCSTLGYMHTTYTMEHFAGLESSEDEENRYNQIEEMTLGYRDYEPDRFTFNFGQYSGRFMYDQTSNQFIQTPFSNLRIEHVLDSSQRIESFLITTPDGFKYYFGKGRDGVSAVDFNSNAVNFSYSSNTFEFSNNSTPVCDHITAWYLKEIVSPTQRSVKFNYQSRRTSQLYKTQESFLPDNSCEVRGFSANFSETYSDVSHLQSIEFTNGRIEFVPDPLDRLDFKGTKALSEIKIYKGNSILKSFDLAYDYFISSPESGKWTSQGDAEERRHRLKLLSVTEVSESGERLPSHSFTYNNIALPSRFSNAQDYWGYFNSKTENPDLIPEVRLPYTPAIYVGDADRTVDIRTSKAGMLKKIIYPTGGSAEYFFESNTASEVISKSESNYSVRNRGEVIYFDFVKAPANYDSSMFMYTRNFTIGPEILGAVEVSTFVTGCDDSPTLSNFECDYLLEIKGITDPDFRMDISSRYFTYEFPPGEYQITAMEAGTGETTDPHFSTSMVWEEDVHAGYHVVGGQRIQKIILTDAKGGTIEKEFSYDSFGQELTSGYTISSPVFVDSQYYNSSCDPNKNVYKITSNSQAPLAGVNGGLVGYKHVTELQRGIIKTESTFSKVGDFGGSAGGDENVLLPDVYYDWVRGNLTQKDEFSYENGDYQLVKSTSIEMEPFSKHFIRYHGLTVISPISNSYHMFKYGLYSGISEWYRPKRTVVTEVFEGQQVVQESVHLYESNPLLPSRTVVTTSENGTVVTDFYYPFDVGVNGEVGTANPLTISPSAFTAVENLKIENRIATPIQVETFQSSGKTALRTNYKTTSGLTLPEVINTTKGSESFEDRLRYNKYDAKGNPLEVFREDGPPVAYIWGYDSTYPVAKVENASYADVVALINMTTINDSSTSDAAMELELNKIRSGLPDAMVTTYTYDPLIGVTSITDPRGDTMTYEYDDFNRLQFIKDEKGNIISENKYNYKESAN